MKKEIYIENPYRNIKTFAVFIVEVKNGPEISEGERLRYLMRKDIIIPKSLMVGQRQTNHVLREYIKKHITQLTDDFIKKWIWKF